MTGVVKTFASGRPLYLMRGLSKIIFNTEVDSFILVHTVIKADKV